MKLATQQLIVRHRQADPEWPDWRVADFADAIRFSDALWEKDEFVDAISLARIALVIGQKAGRPVYPRLHIRNAFGLAAQQRWWEAENEYRRAATGAVDRKDVRLFDDYREYLRQPKISQTVTCIHRTKPEMSWSYEDGHGNMGGQPYTAIEYVDHPITIRRFSHVLKYRGIDANLCYSAVG